MVALVLGFLHMTNRFCLSYRFTYLKFRMDSGSSSQLRLSGKDKVAKWSKIMLMHYFNFSQETMMSCSFAITEHPKKEAKTIIKKNQFHFNATNVHYQNC